MAEGIERGLDDIPRTGQAVLLLVSDGSSTRGNPLDAADVAAARHVRIHTVVGGN